MLIEELIDDGTRIHHYSDEGFISRSSVFQDPVKGSQKVFSIPTGTTRLRFGSYRPSYYKLKELILRKPRVTRKEMAEAFTMSGLTKPAGAKKSQNWVSMCSTMRTRLSM